MSAPLDVNVWTRRRSKRVVVESNGPNMAGCFAGRLFRYLALQSIVPRPASATPQVLSGPRTAPTDRLAAS
jgi:hypothetical protein